MSTRKRTAEEWPRMKVRGGRRRHGHRDVGKALDEMSAALVWVQECLGLFVDEWQRHVMGAVLAFERSAEEAQATRDLGDELGLSPAVVADVITRTLQQSRSDPTDWAIAREELSALARCAREARAGGPRRARGRRGGAAGVAGRPRRAPLGVGPGGECCSAHGGEDSVSGVEIVKVGTEWSHLHISGPAEREVQDWDLEMAIDAAQAEADGPALEVAVGGSMVGAPVVDLIAYGRLLAAHHPAGSEERELLAALAEALDVRRPERVLVQMGCLQLAERRARERVVVLERKLTEALRLVPTPEPTALAAGQNTIGDDDARTP
ncbi:hypothetical protein [Rathayibacter sp. VKM Ac-2630]|uniref:hypothetical protein n=1 Tax=Rathayibacter sp. VKM Ac-2630 TaxID=1938617 RepID=UPI000981B4B5|nr:hypothetical protein [Rathayibacter sp. VKM Ac-2630]OOB90310.1 hypothetical protein B0T42_12480 [Rathayibacter sp. VKM Ac-2630]